MRSKLRQYPALVWLIVAGLLALLLPSGLVLPQSGPSTLAEYAPVPGQSQGDADLGELAGASSDGVGAGGSAARGGTATTIAEPSSRRGRLVRKPGTKRCVGEPPRQTEDPLAPACIAFFDGDNGGATARGVERDEIRIVVYGFRATSSVPAGLHDWTQAPSSSDNVADATGKAFTRYFADRYQTYGRRLRVWGFYSTQAGAEAWAADMALIKEEVDPFAVVTAFDGTGPAAQAAARAGFVAVSYAAFPREVYAEVAPLLMSWTPDIEDQAAIAGRYVCVKLAGRQARWAKDPQLSERTRQFRIAFSQSAALPQIDSYRAALRRRLVDCGVTLDDDVALRASAPDYTQAVTTMRTAGVTSVLLLTSGGSSANLSQAAAAQGWFPEMITLGSGAVDRGNDRNPSARTHAQSSWDRAFGITFDYRRGSIPEQPWFRAAREGCPTCPEPRDVTYVRLYDAWALLMYGIQAAGPKLTPGNVDRGLQAIDQVRSDDPHRPAAYFAPGNHSFVKDAAEIWWDPIGSAPSGTGPGCYRLVAGGLRSRAADWSGGDDHLFDADGAPCQGDEYRAAST